MQDGVCLALLQFLQQATRFQCGLTNDLDTWARRGTTTFWRHPICRKSKIISFLLLTRPIAMKCWRPLQRKLRRILKLAIEL
jgi:hypothetical protein